MAELVECARLEIAYTGNCIEGSNPPISASNRNDLFGRFLLKKLVVELPFFIGKIMCIA